MADAPTDRSNKRRRIAIKLIVMCMLFMLIGVGVTAYFLVGQRVWTDDQTIHVIDGQEYLREVLWTPPRGEDDVNSFDDHEYEPTVTPDGTEMYLVRGRPSPPESDKRPGADIYVSYRRNNAWTPPEPLAAVNTQEIGRASCRERV